MNNIPEDTLSAWKEEHATYREQLPGYSRSGFSFHQGEMFYIAARSHAQAELERLRGDFEEKLNYSIAFHCPNFLTNGSGTVSCQVKKYDFNSYENEIAKRDELIQEIYTYAKMHIPKLQTSSISRFIDDWYKKAEALK